MTAFKATISDHLPLERYAQARQKDGTLSSPELLSHYRDIPAWVLLADPGAGKTDAFNTLSAAEGGYYVSAHDFVDLDLPADWRAPLFIDALDEATAGSVTGATTLSQIRTKLQQLGTPKFRIACREADWRGNTDSVTLQKLVGDDNFLELHLAPLTRDQTLALIAHWQSSHEEDAAKFMREAQNRDLSGLLENPQTLRMLVKAVASSKDGWPTRKTETYELACAQLVKEHSDIHRDAQQDSVLPAEQVLKAAGYLCAVMLLSDSASMARQPPREAHAGTLALTDLSYGNTAPDKTACIAALHTRLFRGTGHHEFVPTHRTVAEYLGARYLTSRIAGGLPASRVLALMLGEDAGIVPELRGLHAWLAATASGELRRTLIERDPLGVVLNGDVRQFTRDEKLQVLNALRDEATRYTYFRSKNWISHPFGALATVDMEGDFKVLLESTDRNPAHLAFLDCVLDALVHGQYMPGLAPVLELVVRDKTYWPSLRKDALKILVSYAHGEDNYTTLTQLLADVHANAVEDLEDELLGTLLKALYPIHLSPAKVWEYFRKPKADHLLGNYWQFWHELPKKAETQKDTCPLLDALVSTGFQLNRTSDHRHTAEIIGELLVRGMMQQDTQVEVQRLYDWLSLGVGPHHSSPLKAEHKSAISRWLGEHPALYTALFEHGLNLQAREGDNAFRDLWRIRARLYSALEPEGAELWYLSLAEANADDALRRQLISDSFQLTHQRKGPNAAIQLLENWSAANANDATWINDYLRCVYPPDESQQEYIDSEIKYRKREAEESRQQFEFFRETLPSFDPGPAHLGALAEVADAYLNFFRHSEKKTPQDRLLELLNQNQEWVHLALHGLRQCLFRDDLPSAVNIVDLHTKSRRYNLATPCLAAMELRYTENPTTALDLPPSLLETVTAFRLTNHFYETPDWFKQLLAQRPAVLSNVMRCLISKKITAKAEHIEGLYDLACDPDYATVAMQITPQLMAEFSPKATTKQLKNLRLLIVSVLTHLDRETQLTLIANKLSAKNMDVTQQAYWLTAGVLLAPELYLERLQQFVGESQVRANHVFALIHERSDRGGLQTDLPVATHVFLIALLGPRSSPSWSRGSDRVTPEMEMGEYVTGLITTLAGNPDDAALQALTDLQQRPDMKPWHDSINRALYDQRITRRKAHFKPAAVADVCATLANLKPANAADLWALTADHLKQLIAEIRHGSTNDYRQYWAGNTPKVENDCRDALMSDLKQRLSLLGVPAEREGSYAEDKRADIKVISGGFHIPVEIKRESHPDVWKAIGSQLIAKYGRETASDGYGIYLVFWFTGQMKAGAADGGGKVKSPQDLQQRLTATVPEALRHKIAVLVVDCSKQQKT